MWTQAAAIGLIAAASGFVPWAVGAILAGAVADLLGPAAAIWTVAALTATSGVVVALRMYENPPPGSTSTGARRGLRLMSSASASDRM